MTKFVLKMYTVLDYMCFINIYIYLCYYWLCKRYNYIL